MERHLHRQQPRLRPAVRSGGRERVGLVHEAVHREEALIPTQIAGLDFALTALFITLTLDAARTWREVPSILLAGASFAVAMVVAPGQHLIVALLLFVACLSVRHLLHRLGIVSSPAPLHSGDTREAGARKAGTSDTEVPEAQARESATPEEAS